MGHARSERRGARSRAAGTGRLTRRRLLTGAVAASAYAGLAPALGLAQDTHGGILTMIVQPEPPILNGAINTAAPVGVVSSKIFGGLLEYDFNFNPKPSLAESWTVSPDGRTVTFRLRRDVLWHDGQRFTAADVKFSIEEILKPLHPRGLGNFGPVTEVQTPDPYTAVFKLEHPYPPMMVSLSSYESPMQPKHLLEPPADLRGPEKKAEREAWIRNNPFHNKPVGTGPFSFAEWQRGDHIAFKRFPAYWRKGLPNVDQMVMKIIPDASARAAALEAGEVDVAGFDAIPYVEVPRLAKRPQLEVTTRGYELLSPLYVMEFNLRRKPFDNVLVRRAIFHALDRKFIVENIWYGFGKVATGPISSNFAGSLYDPGITQYSFDPKKAETLLDEAGVKRGPDGTRFKIFLDYVPYGEDHLRLAEYIKQALGRVGIAVTIRSQDVAAWLKRLFTDYDFDLTTDFYYTLPDPTLGVQRIYWSKNIRKGVPFSNASGYSNPRIDELFEKASGENDRAKRTAMFKEIQKILADDVPIMWIFEIHFATVYNKRVSNLITSPAGLYGVLDRVSLKS